MKKVDLREANQLFTVFTEDYGKICVLGRGIRKIKSKLRSGIDIFYLSEIEFVQGKAYKTLTDAKTINKNKDNFEERLKIGELVDKLVKAPEKDKNIWKLLEEAPKYHYFFWNLLSILGYQVDLYNCSSCHGKLSPIKLSFEPEGIKCSNCSDKSSKNISPEVVKIIRLLLKKDWDILSKLRIKKSHLNELEDMEACFLEEITV
ncbi:DNA repair protein RecO [Patescibacteria group bacterium]|nr:DNA repair protein RecO [Patescibacteria group bacterium]